MKAEYTRSLREYNYGDLISVEEWIDGCENGPAFIDYDGHGYPVKDGFVAVNMRMYPSIHDQMPEDATYILWFNR